MKEKNIADEDDCCQMKRPGLPVFQKTPPCELFLIVEKDHLCIPDLLLEDRFYIVECSENLICITPSGQYEEFL